MDNVVMGFPSLMSALLPTASGFWFTASRKASKVIPFQARAVSAHEESIRAERILNRYGNAILRLAYSYVHNMADAEDVLQEVLIHTMKVNPSFENEAHEKAYLLRAVANVSKNLLEYNKRRETDELKEELENEEREDLSFVWEAVKQLPNLYREVLHLYYVEGYQTAEIARILGRKESTVRSDLKRSRDHLKKVLKEEYDLE